VREGELHKKEGLEPYRRTFLRNIIPGRSTGSRANKPMFFPTKAEEIEVPMFLRM